MIRNPQELITSSADKKKCSLSGEIDSIDDYVCNDGGMEQGRIVNPLVALDQLAAIDVRAAFDALGWIDPRVIVTSTLAQRGIRLIPRNGVVDPLWLELGCPGRGFAAIHVTPVRHTIMRFPDRQKRYELVPIAGHCAGESGAHDDDAEEESRPAKQDGGAALERTRLPDVFQKIVIVERVLGSIQQRFTHR